MVLLISNSCCFRLYLSCVASPLKKVLTAEAVIMLDGLIVKNKEILGGVPVFVGTRVPIQTMIDYFEKGYPLEEFLDDFPTVTLEQAQAALELLKQLLLKNTYESVAG